MSDPLATYVHDHLAGAQFAVELLADLRDHAEDESVSAYASELLPEIEADRAVLQSLDQQLGERGSSVKEAAAWVAQKASRAKLSPGSKLGAFESLEMMALGITGKLSLWHALQTLKTDERLADLDLETLIRRAVAQHERTERLRRGIAPAALLPQQ